MRAFSFLLIFLTFLPGPAAGEGGGRPIDLVLKGRFISLKGDRVEIRYDLSDKVQAEDWFVTKPFRAPGKLEATHENKAVRLEGTGAWCHRAFFTDEVSLEFQMKSWTDRDFGAVVTEDAETDQFILYSVNDLHFQAFDGAARPSHMITRFGVKDDSDRKGDVAFRYIARGKSPRVRKYETLHLKASKDGGDDTFEIGDKSYSGVEMGRKLLDVHIGVYMVEGKALVDELIVRGRLSPRWIEKEGVELRLSKPIDTEEPEDKAARAARELLDQFAVGEIEVRKLLDVIADPDVPEDIREEAKSAVEATEDKTVVPHLVPLLYSQDLITRTLGYKLVRKLVGRSFGYNPKADEDKRSDSVKKLIQYIQKNAAEFRSPR